MKGGSKLRARGADKNGIKKEVHPSRIKQLSRN